MKNEEVNEIMSNHLKKLSEKFEDCVESDEMLEVTQAMVATAEFIIYGNSIINNAEQRYKPRL